ncbi:MAG: hypothetical protein ACRD2J_17560 [Thermoanaerobaculia bacterium]
MAKIASLVLALTAMSCFAQEADPAWLATWDRTQRSRPAKLASVGRIAPAGEPGTPLVIHGRVFREDGATPAPGIVVFAYQTDESGVYNVRGADGWRLHGWARADAEGRFEFRTIRPASYPSGGTPAHVHFTIEGPEVPRRWTSELRFADDPFLTDAERRGAGERFSGVRPVAVRDGVQHVELSLRIEDAGRF